MLFILGTQYLYLGVLRFAYAVSVLVSNTREFKSPSSPLHPALGGREGPGRGGAHGTRGTEILQSQVNLPQRENNTTVVFDSEVSRSKKWRCL